MTEMPSPYDIIQDERIDGLSELVTPYYKPPGEQEYSFPVVGQGVSSEMFQQISRAAGTGVFVQHDAEGAQSPYRLTRLPGGDAETNAKNQMMLRTSNATGRSEAAIEGFFHTQLEDMPVSFPPVTTPTTYYLALTYDPRREEEEAGPISVEVHANKLPTTHGRKHIVLYTLRREPNQLLTQATTQQHKPWLGHVINVWRYNDLPEPTSVEYGTFAVVINHQKGNGGVPDLYTNRSGHGWISILQDDKFDVTYLQNNWENYRGFGNLKGTISRGVVHLQGTVRRGAWIAGRNIATVHRRAAPAKTCFLDVRSASSTNRPDIRINADGEIFINGTGGIGNPSFLTFDGVSYPLGA
ncbi:hypothetical protein QDX21_05115 [Auritidibacter ignavus]|uniref:Uncharacterized protein n=1 Tax=Auritidibacter ignavus TaxID=678932 RepID=A0AAJ6AJ04_9MICC|nr:hypothetical protein [Auritidibacter ignavus]WGH94175.1 hypothetical protein QDX21_05115 [Auritidibacter ignavus]